MSWWPEVYRTHRPYYDGLAELIQRVRPYRGLEIGFGTEAISTHAFLDNCSGTLLTVEIRDHPRRKEMELRYGGRYRFLHSDSRFANVEGCFDYIYIDGDHSFEGCLNDILRFTPHLARGGIVVMDDYGIPEYGVKDACKVGFGPDWKLGFESVPLDHGGRVYVRTTW